MNRISGRGGGEEIKHKNFFDFFGFVILIVFFPTTSLKIDLPQIDAARRKLNVVSFLYSCQT